MALSRQFIATIVLLGCVLLFAGQAQATNKTPDSDVWYKAPEYRLALFTSVYTTHFNPKPEHNNTQQLLTVEFYGSYFRPTAAQQVRDWFDLAKPLVGVAHFMNSYHQESVYAYLGVQQNLRQFGQVQTYAKVTAGLIHGYRGEYRDKIPFNTMGIAPAAVPMIGMRYQRFTSEIILFGASGVMFTVGLRF